MRAGHRLFILLFAISNSSHASIAQSREWKKLVHWESDFLWIKRSQPDGQGFYLAPDGKTNLEGELSATLAAFRDDSPKGEAARCAFPARWMLLSKSFPDLAAKHSLETCADFVHFRDGISARSATLVFSSYYLDAPASAFGHTFLRLNKAPHEATKDTKRELLDAGVNFGATQTTSNPVLYPIFGLTGMFKGEFSRLPYYFKVREYGDFEARDLWEYNLNLSQSEIDMLTAHIWELGHTYLDYFYFSENCSFHMLTMLEAAAPRLHLIDQLPPWTIPSETIRVLNAQPGLVHSIEYRPSMRSVFYSRAKDLDANQKTWVKRLAVESNKSVLAEFLAQTPTNEDRIKVIDATSDYIDYRHPSKAIASDDRGPWTAAKLNLLSARAKLGIAPLHVVPIPENESPQLGHPSRRWGFRYSQGADRALLLDFRFALHDRFDPLFGYAVGSTLEFLRLSAGYSFDRQRLWTDEITLLSAATLNRIDTFNRKASWKVKMGFRRESLWNCGNCMPFGAEFAYGAHFDLLSKAHLTLTALLEGDLLLSQSLTHGVAVFAGPWFELSRKAYDMAGFSLYYSARTRINDEWNYIDRTGARVFFDLTKRFQLHGKLEFQKNHNVDDAKWQQLWQIGFSHYY